MVAGLRLMLQQCQQRQLPFHWGWQRLLLLLLLLLLL
jgi:hypothetical protein